LAGGTFSGEIVIWSIYQEIEPVLASASHIHSEPISKLEWHKCSGGEFNVIIKTLIYNKLVSVGNDGKICVWNWNGKVLEPWMG